MTKETGKRLDDAGPRTRAIRSGIRRTPEGEHAEPISTSSGFLFDSPEDAAAKFAGEVDGNGYSRSTNPTVRAFEKRLRATRCCGYIRGVGADCRGSREFTVRLSARLKDADALGCRGHL